MHDSELMIEHHVRITRRHDIPCYECGVTLQEGDSSDLLAQISYQQSVGVLGPVLFTPRVVRHKQSNPTCATAQKRGSEAGNATMS